MSTLTLAVVTAEGAVAETDAESVTLPTKDGEITVLPNHIPLVSVLVPGVITYRNKDDEHHLAVSGGFVQVTGKELNVLADTAERADDIDVTRAEQARKKAHEAMEARSEKEDVAEASATLQRNLARLKAAELIKKRRRG